MKKNNIKLAMLIAFILLTILIFIGRWLILTPDSFIYALDKIEVKTHAHNITIELYEEAPLMRNIWRVYYKVKDNEDIVCPCSFLDLGSINWDNSKFDYVMVEDIIYIRNLNDCQIAGIYNIKTQKCEQTCPVDSIFLKYPVIDSMTHKVNCRSN